MNNNNSGGFDIFGTTQVVLIILKLFNLIQLNWWQVFIPTYLNIALILLVIFIAFIRGL